MGVRIGNSGFAVSEDELTFFLILFFVILITCCILIWLIYAIYRNGDKGKPLNHCRVKVIEKNVVPNNLSPTWYVVETENGERLRLRSFKSNNLIISKGDIGIITYQGKTITDFRR